MYNLTGYISFKAVSALAVPFCEALYNQIQKDCVRPHRLSLLVPYHWGPTPLHPKGPPPLGPHPRGSGSLGGTNWLQSAASSWKFQPELGWLEP